MKTKEDFKAIAAVFNMLCQENKNRTFSNDELKKALNGILPTDCTSKSEMIKANIIIHVARGKYMLPSDPIHWTRFETFYKTCRERRRTYLKPDSTLYGKPITTVISDLKSLGYVILKKM